MQADSISTLEEAPPTATPWYKTDIFAYVTVGVGCGLIVLVFILAVWKCCFDKEDRRYAKARFLGNPSGAWVAPGHPGYQQYGVWMLPPDGSPPHAVPSAGQQFYPPTAAVPAFRPSYVGGAGTRGQWGPTKPPSTMLFQSYPPTPREQQLPVGRASMSGGSKKVDEQPVSEGQPQSRATSGDTTPKSILRNQSEHTINSLLVSPHAATANSTASGSVEPPSSVEQPRLAAETPRVGTEPPRVVEPPGAAEPPSLAPGLPRADEPPTAKEPPHATEQQTGKEPQHAAEPPRGKEPPPEKVAPRGKSAPPEDEQLSVKEQPSVKEPPRGKESSRGKERQHGKEPPIKKVPSRGTARQPKHDTPRGAARYVEPTSVEKEKRELPKPILKKGGSRTSAIVAVESETFGQESDDAPITAKPSKIRWQVGTTARTDKQADVPPDHEAGVGDQETASFVTTVGSTSSS